MKLLHIDSSILGTHSASREIGAAWVDAWRRANPDSVTVYRDLATDPLTHLTADVAMARAAPNDINDSTLRQRVDADEVVIKEFLEAEVVVIGAPMYNFSVPSQLKAWIDRIVVAGRTFKYGATGPIGLAAGKKVVIISTRGGVHSEGPSSAFDHQESYLRSVFTFIGVTDIEFVRAEGLHVSAEKRAESMSAAHTAITAPIKLAA
jgi:FMN-dependent NADH-azoreductase